MVKFLKCSFVVMILGSTSFKVFAQGAESQANNPLANMKAFNIQNYYTGELTDTPGKDANQLIFRYAQPFNVGESKWLMRASVPYNALPVGANQKTQTGLGDADIFAAYLIDTGNPSVSFGIGPSVVAPTSSKDELGSEQWQLGAANVYFNANSSRFQFGYLAIYRSGIGDTHDQSRVNMFALQPFGFFQLGQGWYTGTAPLWNFNWANGNYSVPIGLRLGKVLKKEKTVFNLFAEPQVSIADEGSARPVWQIFAGLNMQFK